jgi:hypothetical protein
MPNSGKLGSLDAWREEQGLIEQATGGGALPAGGEATPTGEPVAVLAMDDADALPATGGALLQAGQHAPVAVSVRCLFCQGFGGIQKEPRLGELRDSLPARRRGRRAHS